MSRFKRLRRFLRCLWLTGGLHELDIASGRCRFCYRIPGERRQGA